MNQFFLLFWEFFKIGILALGGGMSTIPFLFELSKKYPNWFSENELVDIISISESTPGPIGINMSTYCGYNVAGIPGSFVSTLSLILPAFIIIFIVSKYMYFTEKKLVKNAMYGLKPIVIVLFIIALSNIFKLTFFNDLSLADLQNSFRYKEIFVFLIVFVLSNIFSKIHNIFWILSTGLLFVLIG